MVGARERKEPAPFHFSFVTSCVVRVIRSTWEKMSYQMAERRTVYRDDMQ